MPYRFTLLFPLLLLAACDPPQPQLHTLTITPYSQDDEPLTGSISIWRYDKQNFLLPEAIIDCNAEEPVDDPEEGTAPSYEIQLAKGRYRITAHDLEHRCEYRQELIITSNSPKWLYVDIIPD